MKNSTLIVGGAGFLGNSLAKHLSDLGEHVFVTDTRRRLDSYAEIDRKIEYIETDWPDITKLANAPEFNNVIHLAWTTSPASSMNNIVDDANTNIIGTLNLLESNIASSLNKFIFMSSGGTVYGNSHEGKLNEDSPTRPISAYGISKLACENYIQLYALRKQFTPIVIRLGNPYGNYQLQGTPTGVIANFVRKIYADETLEIYGNGETIRDYIHIQDTMAFVEKLLLHPTATGIYNLGSGQGMSVKNIIDSIAQFTNKPININHLECRRGDVRSIVLNIDKLQTEVNHGPDISIKTGIASMVAYQSLLSARCSQPRKPLNSIDL